MSKMKRMAIVAAMALGMAVSGAAAASAQDVRTNYVPGTDFSKYKTYMWVKVEGATHPDQIVDGQIRQAVDTALAAKGLTKATGDTADLAVAYQVAVNQERQWTAYGMGGPGAYRYGGMGMGTATSQTINIGTLDLDLYDASARELVWKGIATKTLNPSKDPQKNQERLQKAVTKLLKDYPPKPKK